MRSSKLLCMDPTAPRLVPPIDEVRIAVALSLIEDAVEPLHEYLLFGIPPGEFFDALLQNDLELAWSCGTRKNRHALGDYVSFLRETAPRKAWGSKAAVCTWMQKGLALRAWALMVRNADARPEGVRPS
jgi:hypothetical protein